MCVLHEAFHGNTKTPPGLLEIVGQFKQKLVDTGHRNTKQHVLLEDIAAAFPDDTFQALRRRLPGLQGLAQVRVNQIDFCQVQLFYASLPSTWSVNLLRTLWNGWPTSSRYHESTVLPPLCGCN